jgi:type IV secretion system protein VirB10
MNTPLGPDAETPPPDARSSTAAAPEEGALAGERGIPSVNRVRSMQSRVTTLLAFGCVSVMGLGLLGWYYTKALTRQHRTEERAQSASKERARGEMTLPPLGHLEPPRLATPAPSPATSDRNTTVEDILGPRPELPASAAAGTPLAPGAYSTAYSASTPNVYSSPATKTPAQLAFERRLSGPVFSSGASATGPDAASSATPYVRATAGTADAPAAVSAAAMAKGPPGVAPQTNPSSAAVDAMGTLLQARVTSAESAKVLPTQRFLIPKGANIDCTLETAIDTTLPGLTTCITATDVFGVDGTTVLMERGSQLTGETRGELRQGAARVFVLWSEARTPSGVVIALASPGADELGRSGLPGSVDRHFFERFGAALLISVIEGGVQAASRPSNGGGTVILNPSSTQDITTEVLKSTVNIPPTLRKQHGDRIQVLVARDLDFRSVYELRPAAVRE